MKKLKKQQVLNEFDRLMVYMEKNFKCTKWMMVSLGPRTMIVFSEN